MRSPATVGSLRLDLEKDEVVLAPEVLSHRFQCFPINAFIINADASPVWLITENLVEKRSDPTAGFPGASIPCDEPASAEVFASPLHAFKTDDNLRRTLAAWFEKKSEKREGFEESSHDP